MDDKNKKMGLWVLLAVVVLGAGFYFVSKNSSSLVAVNNEVIPKSQTAEVNFYNFNQSDCTAMVRFSNANGVTFRSMTGHKNKAGKCEYDLGDWGFYTVYWGYPVTQPVGSNDPTTGNKFDPTTPVPTPVATFDLNVVTNDKTKKNFLDWDVYKTNTCYKSFTDVEPMTKDQNIIPRFVYDMTTEAGAVIAYPFPWTGASDKCTAGAPQPTVAN